MPRIVPSQIVVLIDMLFPNLDTSKKKEIVISSKDRISVATIVELIDKLSIDKYPLNSGQYIKILYGLTGLKQIIEIWKTNPQTSIQSYLGTNATNPILMIRKALDKCPDEFISPESSKLEFVKDDEWRNNLELDISSMERALSNGEWKASTIIAGSIIEALLLWALDGREKRKVTDTATRLKNSSIINTQPSSLNDWSLHHYIEVARAMGIISERTKTETNQAKNFRNLIHPGREIRKNQKCSRATTLSAVSAVEFVIEDLRSYCGNGSE